MASFAVKILPYETLSVEKMDDFLADLTAN